MTQTTLSLRYAALSDVGRVRKDNQDSGFASERLLLIADGVGGAARGDIASSTAVQILRRLDSPPPEDLLKALAGAIHRAHDRIAELVDEDPELEGTSTTVTAALFDGTRVGIGHVGDSRGYLLRDGQLSQLTRDHTFVQSLIDEGRITEEESRVHPHRNLILRAVDGVHETDPDLFLVDLAPGDRLLLCSDGCSGVLDNDRLTDILSTGTIDYAVVELIRASLDAGSSDNITCVVADALLDDESAAVATGPMLVGAAAEQSRKAGAGAKGFFRGHRGGDTGELEPVPNDGPNDGPNGGPGGQPGDRPGGQPGGQPGVRPGDRPRSQAGEEDPEVLRYAPRPPRRFIWLRRLAILVAIVLVFALAATIAYRWTQNQYYVAGDGDGERVAIYKGVEADIPGLTLTSIYEDTDVTLASLSNFRADTVRSGIVADDLDDARGIVENLGDLAIVCPEPRRQPRSTPDSSPDSSPGRATSSPDSRPDQSPRDGQSSPSTRQPEPTPSADSSDAGSGDGGSPSASPSPTLAPPDCVEATP